MKYIRLIKADQKDKKNLKLENIAEYSGDAYDYAEDLGFKNVPDIIVKSIARNSAYSRYYAEALNFKNVPDIIFKSIVSDSYTSYRYAEDLGFKNVPDIIVKSAARNSEVAYYYAEALNFKNVPDIIVKGIAKDSDYAYKYAEALNFENVPDIIMKKIQPIINFRKSKNFKKIKNFLIKFADFFERRYNVANNNLELYDIDQIKNYNISGDEMIFETNVMGFPQTSSGLGKSVKYDLVYIKINTITEQVDFKISGEVIKYYSHEDEPEVLKEVNEEKQFTIDQFLKAKGKK